MFQRLIFAFERIRHRRDGGTNQNYHLSGFSVDAAGAFQGYLLYHVLLHMASLLLLAGFAFWKHVSHTGQNSAGLFICVLCIFNLECIMLQRYNALRIRQLRGRRRVIRARRTSRQAGQISSAFPAQYQPDWLREDLLLVRRMLDGLSNGQNVFLDQGVSPSLSRMAALLERADALPSRPVQPVLKENAGMPANQLAARCRRSSQPYSALEALVDRIQRLIPLKESTPLLSRCAIVTESAQTEAAFSRLFPQSSPSAIMETLLLLAMVLDMHSSGEG